MLRVVIAPVCVLLSLGVATLAQGFLPTAYPDLVVLEVTYDHIMKDWMEHTFTIVVKNVGTGNATIATKVAVLIVPDIYHVCGSGLAIESCPAGLFGTASVPPISAGASATVKVSATGKPDLGPTLVIVLADAPIPGKPLGQLSEHGALISITGAYPGEMNNAFMFPLKAGLTVPATFKNPAF